MSARKLNGSSATVNLSDLESLTVTCRISSQGVDLSAAERKLLQDPNWITEDEADAIVADRIYRREGRRAGPLREYLRKRGITVDR